MVVTIDSTNPRSVAALELMTQAGQWGKAHLRDGQKFYAVPSRSEPSVRYLVDTHSCTCPDHKWRGVDCAHILAVRLHVARVKAQREARPAAAPGPRLDPARVAALSAEYERLYPAADEPAAGVS